MTVSAHWPRLLDGGHQSLTSYALASPGWVAVAVHALWRSESITCVAAMMAMRSPWIVVS